nr:hypothetical protein [Tanacetum cinerariifolium]
RIAQSSALPTVADEPASLVRDVSEGEACLTESGFLADQDSATIAKSSTLPHDSAPRAQEEEIVKLKDRVKVLEDKEDVAITYGFIPTAGPPATIISIGSEDGPTTSLIVTRRKGKEVMVESDTPKKKKLQKQIDAQSSEEAPEIETSIEEFTEEKMKEMMQLVPVKDVYVQALQVKHSIIDWKVHTEVKEYLSSRPATNDKEMELWVELKRMYEPDPEDQLWTLTQNFMHAPVEWKLYDLSGVHHLTAKDR